MPAVRRRVLCPVLSALVVLAVGSPLVASTLELPVELPLGVDSRLFLELDNADLTLTSRPEELGVLRARATVESTGGRLDCVSSGGSLTVRRSAEESEGAPHAPQPRLRLDIELGAGRTVHITGVDLSVKAQGRLENSGRGTYVLTLERSTAHLKGVRISRLQASESSLVLTGTEGSLALNLTGGSARLDGHHGALELRAGEADVEVGNHEGEIKPTLEGGSLEILAGTGTVTAGAHGAELFFDGWQGDVEVAATDSLVDARETQSRGRWQIGGRNLEVNLNRIRGTVGVDLLGGSLQGSHLHGELQLAAGADTQVEMVGIEGSLVVDLSQGATGWLSEVAATVEATVSDSQLDLDLSEVGGSPSLDLQGSGYARVRLREPCVVQLSAAATAEASINAGSCELLGLGQAPSGRPTGVRPTRLHVTMSPATVLDVEGVP